MSDSNHVSPRPSLSELARRFRAGDRRALARLITQLDDGQDPVPILAAVGLTDRSALKIGVTGSAGAGKSTLVGALLQHVRRRGQRVAVLACDPESPFTGGALLGDRVRMNYDPTDSDAYMRSLSLRGGLGGLSAHIGSIVTLVERFGFDVLLIETVGAGQDQLAAADIVDILLLVVTPAGGDDIQWEKAGVMEAADVIAVNKSDLPGSDAAVASLKAMLELAPADDPTRHTSVVKVIANKGVGVPELWSAIETRVASGAPHRRAATSRHWLDAMQRRLSALLPLRFESEDALADWLSESAGADESEEAIADRLLAYLVRNRASA